MSIIPVDDNAHGPRVNHILVPRPLLGLHDDLGGKVLRGPNQGDQHRLGVNHLCETKVCNLDDARLLIGFLGQQDVLGLEVAMSDTVLMLLSVMFPKKTHAVRHCSADLESKLG